MSPFLRCRTTRPLQCCHQTKVKWGFLGKFTLSKVTTSHSLHPQSPSGMPVTLCTGEARGSWEASSLWVWGLEATDDWKETKGGRAGPLLGGSVTDRTQVKLGPSPPPMTGPPHLHKFWATDRPGVTLADARSEVPPHSYSLAKLSNALSLSLPPPL